MAQNRITIPQWQGIKAGQEVETGFPGIVLTAPSEPSFLCVLLSVCYQLVIMLYTVLLSLCNQSVSKV